GHPHCDFQRGFFCGITVAVEAGQPDCRLPLGNDLSFSQSLATERSMKRRLMLLVIVVVTAAQGISAEAQQPTKLARIGFLIAACRSAISARTEVFQQGLRELGYVEGKNIVIEWRSSEGQLDRLPALAAELVHLKVEAIVTTGSGVTRAAKEATVTIPIVMVQDNDPVANGFVASLARPGGNI